MSRDALRRICGLSARESPVCESPVCESPVCESPVCEHDERGILILSAINAVRGIILRGWSVKCRWG